MSDNKTVDEIPAEVLRELQQETGAPPPNLEEPAPPAQAPPVQEPPKEDETITRIINGINRLGSEIQATQAAVLRAQMHSKMLEDKLWELAVEIKELKNNFFSPKKPDGNRS